MEFSRSKYWSGQPFPSPGDLPNPGIIPRSPTLQEDSFTTELSGKPPWGSKVVCRDLCRWGAQYLRGAKSLPLQWWLREKKHKIRIDGGKGQALQASEDLGLYLENSVELLNMLSGRGIHVERSCSLKSIEQILRVIGGHGGYRG